MRKLMFLGMLVLCCAAADKESSDLKVVGGGTVPAPAEGYKWQNVRETKEGETPKVQIFAATKEGGTAKVVLIVEDTVADTDAKKLARIKGDYNGMVTSLQEQGYTELKGTKPPLAPPFKERVSFSLTGNDKDGKPAAFQSIIFFGKIGRAS